MLAVKCSKDQFAYDIHSLVKAFYPAEDVKVFEEGERVFFSDSNLPDISILLDPDRLEVHFTSDHQERISRSFIFTEEKDRIAYKNELKKLLYDALAQYTGRELPWGTLTGIRPVKIPYAMIKEGKKQNEILSYMKDTYRCSKEKASLAYEIAQKEHEILSHIHYRNGYSLYIGIPFCPTTCLYCSFTSYPIAIYREKVKDYLDALKKEIDYVQDVFSDRVLDTVYIGGGTPTTLTAQELQILLSYLNERLDLSCIKEFTVEAGRADSITRDKLKVLKEYGVTRISVNPQTMQQKTLDLIGRKHTVRQVKEAFFLARDEEFDNINMDLILGLPNETIQDLEDTLREVEQLEPDSLTVHSLAIKRASKLNEWISHNDISCLQNTELTMHAATCAAKRMKMDPYYLYRQKNMAGNLENVGYAKKGRYGIYNILIMEEVQTIVALGAGTITKRVFQDGRIERCDNVKDVAGYIARIEEMIERKRMLFHD